jgi:rhodanese-related sulfurtransferase
MACRRLPEAPEVEGYMKPVIAAAVIALGMVVGVSGADVRPAREYAKVRFQDPVRVLNHVLMGDYLIEHDTDRMARGGPCTHIYKMSDRTKPVVAFHCRHLTRSQSTRATVTVRRAFDMSPTRAFIMTEFQFAGSADGHGVPE